MSSSCRSRRLPRALAALAVTTGLALGSPSVAAASTVGVSSSAGSAAQSDTTGTTGTAKKKSDTAEAQSWVGGNNLISTKEQLDLPDGVPEPPVPDSTSWLIADLDTREILAAKNVHVPLAPASTLKIFTSLALAPELDADQVYTGRTADQEIDGTRVGIVAGSKYTVNDLLHGLLMSSGNDCANALANLVGGMSSATKLMRAKAKELGAFDTVIHNTSGLDAKGQVTSAYDLALAGSAALQNEQLAKIMVTESYSFPAEGTSLGSDRETFSTQNHNGLLGYLDGITGIKNGYTTSALASDVASATRGKHSYIAVVMRTESSVFTQAGDLLTWAFKYGQKANAVGTLVEPGELDAMTGPNVTPTADTTTDDQAVSTASESSAETLVAGSSGSSSGLQSALASGASTVEHSMIRFWPLVGAVAVLLMIAGFFVLRPMLAGGLGGRRSPRPAGRRDLRREPRPDPRYGPPPGPRDDPRAYAAGVGGYEPDEYRQNGRSADGPGREMSGSDSPASDGYRSDAYGSDGYRSDGYRSDAYRSDGYRADGYGSDGYRSEGRRSADAAAAGHGPEGFRSADRSAASRERGGEVTGPWAATRQPPAPANSGAGPRPRDERGPRPDDSGTYPTRRSARRAEETGAHQPDTGAYRQDPGAPYRADAGSRLRSAAADPYRSDDSGAYRNRTGSHPADSGAHPGRPDNGSHRPGDTGAYRSDTGAYQQDTGAYRSDSADGSDPQERTDQSSSPDLRSRRRSRHGY